MDFSCFSSSFLLCYFVVFFWDVNSERIYTRRLVCYKRFGAMCVFIVPVLCYMSRRQSAYRHHQFFWEFCWAILYQWNKGGTQVSSCLETVGLHSLKHDLRIWLLGHIFFCLTKYCRTAWLSREETMAPFIKRYKLGGLVVRRVYWDWD